MKFVFLENLLKTSLSDVNFFVQSTFQSPKFHEILVNLFIAIKQNNNQTPYFRYPEYCC